MSIVNVQAIKFARVGRASLGPARRMPNAYLLYVALMVYVGMWIVLSMMNAGTVNFVTIILVYGPVNY